VPKTDSGNSFVNSFNDFPSKNPFAIILTSFSTEEISQLSPVISDIIGLFK
jgi:hypothetical protein